MSVAIGRRDTLALLAAGSAATMLPMPARAAMGGAAALPVDDPLWTARAYARLEGDVAGAKVWECVDGYIVGVTPNDLPRVLTGFSQVKCSRMTDNRDGSFTHRYGGVYMFTDLETGALLDAWRNPYNGRETRPFHYRSGPSETLITPTGLKSLANRAAPGAPLKLSWFRLGDDVWARSNSATWFPSFLMPDHWPLESPGTRMISGFLLSWKTSARALLDPTVTSLPSELYTSAQSNWLPWMLMGTSPGLAMYHVVGRKLARFADIPERTRQMAEKLHPSYLEDPFGFPKTLQHSEFLRLRKPTSR